jgi:MULE transposase domain
MSAPSLDTLEHITPIPISGGSYNQCDEFESSLSDNEAIITLVQGTENSNSEAIMDALSDDDDKEEEGFAPRTWEIPPPPPGIFSSREDTVNACNTWAGKHGYALIISGYQRKSKKSGQIYLHRLDCSRGRPHRGLKYGENYILMKDMGSKKGNCPMKVMIKALDIDNIAGSWEVRYSLAGGEREHNHPLDHLISLPLHRRQFQERHR